MNITIEKIKTHFEYKDGNLYWKKPTSRTVKIGNLAGCESNGYRIIRINGKYIYMHQAIYLLFHGYIPKIIDHVDNNRKNSKIENLREATKAQNAWNAKLNCRNTSGVRGVSWNKQTKKWRAALMVNGKSLHLGRFSDIQDAENAVKLARKQHYGNYSLIEQG